jgi:rubrerythrin
VKRFADLSEQDVLALAISNEDEDNRIYRSFADALRGSYPDTAQMYDKMAEEEISHRDMLLALHRKRFGEFLPLIRRQDVKGFVARRPIWLNRPLAIDAVRKFAEEMEYETARFYRRAAHSAHDDATRDLLRTLAEAEDKHEQLAHQLGKDITPGEREVEDATAKRMFVLQYVQPGLAGLMDGSVSTLAPLFAAAFATHNTWSTFLVGLAAALGAGHALPYLIPDFYIATVLAFAVVAVELLAISWIRTHYMDTPFLQAVFQVVVGGVLVFGLGILIGSS